MLELLLFVLTLAGFLALLNLPAVVARVRTILSRNPR